VGGANRRPFGGRSFLLSKTRGGPTPPPNDAPWNTARPTCYQPAISFSTNRRADVPGSTWRSSCFPPTTAAPRWPEPRDRERENPARRWKSNRRVPPPPHPPTPHPCSDQDNACRQYKNRQYKTTFQPRLRRFMASDGRHTRILRTTLRASPGSHPCSSPDQSVPVAEFHARTSPAA